VTTTCVIQARTGSTRLPGKVLSDLGGRPMLGFMLERLRNLPVDALVVATSTLDRDDPVCDIAASVDIPTVRGAEADVLARFADVLERHPADTVVRLTGDCPLIDPDVVIATLTLHKERTADYTSNVLPRTFPRGLDVEVVAASALLSAAEEAHDPAEREHVTPFVYRRPERFRLANLRSGESLGNESWTVDTAADLEFVRDVVNRLDDGASAGWRDVLAVAGRHSLPSPGELYLQPATLDDSAALLRWRNEDDAVRFSQSGRAIEEQEHIIWLTAALDSPQSRIWIGEVDGRGVGSVRIAVTAAVGTVSVVVDPDERGHGYGSGLLHLLQRELNSDRQVVELRATIREDNAASVAAFLKTGFVIVPDAATGSFIEMSWTRPD
jgi:spore coat polysaccharide biosynthesis protein SpsF